jgi:predicted dehydrogenase
MTRIGIVGSDNSHAVAFSKLCNVEGNDVHIDGAKVVAIYGRDSGRNQEVAEEGNIPEIVASPEDMIGKIDAALVVFRDGRLHREHAEPLIRAKIPTFVDKPLAISVEDATALIDLAEDNGTPLTSFSTLRYATDMVAFINEANEVGPISSGVLTGPADRASEYGGLPFYGVHIVEMMQALYGPGVRSVHAVEQGKTIVATVVFDDRIMTLNFIGDASYVFHMLAFGKSGWVGRALDAGSCYKDGLEVVLEMVKTGKWPIGREELLEPVKTLEAIEKSLDTGTTVEL